MRRDGTKSKLNGESDGFIPLSTTKTIEKVAHSRLVREDENDMSDEDGENNQEFYSSKSLLISEEERRRKEQEEFLRVEGESDEEEGDGTASADEEAQKRAQESDEEFAEWENHQIGKAVSSHKVKQMKRENYAVTNEVPPEVINLEDGEEDMDIEIVEEPSGFKGLLALFKGFIMGTFFRWQYSDMFPNKFNRNNGKAKEAVSPCDSFST